MTDSQNESLLSKPIDDKDWMLVSLVSWANLGFALEVTLTTSAGLVSGVMCSGKEYVEYMESNLLKGFSGEGAEVIANIFSLWKDGYSEEALADADPEETVYIHLKEASLYASGQLVPNGGVYWRGRICEVLGFSLGRLSVKHQ